LSTLKELEPLANVPSLTSLSLVDNPVTKVKDYRAFVIAMLPRLKILDYKRCARRLPRQSSRAPPLST
jgi:U2 small nuclear ribonucleoprotein A'